MARKSTKKTTEVVAEVPVTQPDTEAKEPLKKPVLLDDIVARTNLKKRDVKPAVEAALSILGDVLREGGELNLPPLGKVRVVKSKDLEGGASVLTLKLRMPKNATVAAQGADDA